MAIEFFWTSGGPYAWRCLLALEAKRLAYTSTLVDLAGGATRTPRFLAMNPRGTLPVLVDDFVTVRESQAVIYYLDRAYPQTPLYGGTPAEAARIMQEVNDQASYLETPLRSIIVPLVFSKARPDEVAILLAANKVREEFAALNERLANQRYLAGDTLSAADIHLYPFLPVLDHGLLSPLAVDFDTKLSPIGRYFPHIARWMAMIAALPGYERTVPQWP